MLDNLSNLLKKSQNLIHLQLNDCGLSFNIIKDLLPYIQKSPSLVSLHLCENELFSKRYNVSIMQLLRKLDIYKIKSTNYDHSQNQQSGNFQDFIVNNYQLQDVSQNVFEVSQKELESKQINSLTNQVKEQLQIKNILREKQILTNYLFEKDFKDNNTFILQRIIGFDNQLVTKDKDKRI